MNTRLSTKFRTDRSSAEIDSQSVADQRTMADILNSYTEEHAPVKRVKRKHRKAIKSRGRSYSWDETPYAGFNYPRELGLTNLTAFVRLALEFYVSYREVPFPVMNEDGSIQLDNFGRPRALRRYQVPADVFEADYGLEDFHKIARGAVWMSKKAIHEAWISMHGGGYYKDTDEREYDIVPITMDTGDRSFADMYALAVKDMLRPQGRFADLQSRKRSKHAKQVSMASDMDTVFHRLVRTGQLIPCPHTRGRYMFSQEMCEQAKMPEAWEIHKQRGERWEGLYYEPMTVRYRDIYKQKTYQFEGETTRRLRPRTTIISHRHPNQSKWDHVLYMLTPAVLFDKAMLTHLANQEDMAAEGGVNSFTVDSHLERWMATGKVKRVFPGLYRSEAFWDWNEKRDPREEMRSPANLDWMINFFFNQSQSQFVIPTLAFTITDVYDWLISYRDGTPAQQRKFAYWFDGRDDVTKGMISERLRDYLKKDYVLRVGARKWQLTDYVMNACRPAWSRPGDMEPSRKGSYKQRHIMLASMPLDEAIKALTGTEQNETIHMLITRIFKESPPDEEITNPRFLRIARKTGYKSMQTLLKAYKAGRLDEGG